MDKYQGKSLLDLYKYLTRNLCGALHEKFITSIFNQMIDNMDTTIIFSYYRRPKKLILSKQLFEIMVANKTIRVEREMK